MAVGAFGWTVVVESQVDEALFSLTKPTAGFAQAGQTGHRTLTDSGKGMFHW